MNQQEALDILKMGKNVFLTGSPGAGKTFLLNAYIDYLVKNNKAVAVTASTGIAATHMDGITIHSWSGLGIKEHISDKDIKALMKRKYLFNRIRSTRVLIIDEVSMLKASQFDAIDKICQYFKASFLPFGGMQVILSGDFFQLPPIERNNRETNFITSSSAWKNMDMKVCYLEGQFRQKDSRLSELLDSIRQNKVEDSKAMLASLAESHQDNNIPISTKLYTHNTDVDAINNFELGKINQQEFVYHMTSNGPKDIVESLKKSCLSPEKLVLKIGAKVMFVKNNFDSGYVNGTQGTVVGFDQEQFPIIDTFFGDTIVAKLAGWTINDEENKPVAQINQLPLRLAWAITVHKSQGMNLDSAQVDLSRCFIEGMGYVALSRVRSWAGLKVVGINDMALYVNEKALMMDKDFKEHSQSLAQELADMGNQKIQKQQTQFLASLA